MAIRIRRNGSGCLQDGGIKLNRKVLSSNDFTDELKAKLEAGPEVATDAEVAEMLAEIFGAAS